MERYALVHDVARSELQTASVSFEEPPLATDDEMRLVHDDAYLRVLFSGALSRESLSRVGLGAWSDEWATRTRLITGATLAAMRRSLTSCRSLDAVSSSWRGPGGVACVAAGGTHHAFPAHGEGYCFVNDLAVAARVALTDPALGVRRVAVLDVDVHQGNGTAACLAAEPRAVTVSVHGARNYPWSTRFAGSYDIDVPDDATDAVYLTGVRDALALLEGLSRAAAADPGGLLRLHRANGLAARRAGWGEKVLPGLPREDEVRRDPLIAAVVAAEPDAAMDVARAAARSWAAGCPLSSAVLPQPDSLPPPAFNSLASIDLLLVQAGVDCLEGDRLGRLRVSRAGLQERNRLIFEWADDRGVPVCVTMGGGYGRDLRASALAHVDVFREAAASHARRCKAYPLFAEASS